MSSNVVLHPWLPVSSVPPSPSRPLVSVHHPGAAAASSTNRGLTRSPPPQTPSRVLGAPFDKAQTPERRDAVSSPSISMPTAGHGTQRCSLNVRGMNDFRLPCSARSSSSSSPVPGVLGRGRVCDILGFIPVLLLRAHWALATLGLWGLCIYASLPSSRVSPGCFLLLVPVPLMSICTPNASPPGKRPR